MGDAELSERTVVTGAEGAREVERTAIARGLGPPDDTGRDGPLLDKLAVPLGELIKIRLRKTGEGGRIGRYVILRLLGEGGMGTVFSAFDEELDRKVAIKLLRADGPAGKLDRAWLLSEAKAMARLSHPNVVQIYDVGELDDPSGAGQIFIAMELVSGTTLSRWLRDGKRDRAAILDRFVQAGEGLAAVHAAGLIHRDFKPANVLIGDDGRVRVLDFGLAYRPVDPGAARAGVRVDESAASQTHAGTPAYMAPEQHLDKEVDARADQFAFGVALHEALYGARPFAGRLIPEITAAVIANDRAPPPTDVKVPAHLRRLIDRALQPLPIDRYPTMDALLRDLKSDPWRRRRLTLVIGGLALALAIALGLLAQQRAADAAREAAACAGGPPRAAEVWSPPRRDAAAAAFAATDLPYAEDTWSKVQDRLDAYAERWAATYRSTCEEHRGGGLTDNLYERASACLDAGLRDLEAVAAVYAEADAKVVESALKASEGLPPLDRCRDRHHLVTGLAPIRDQATATAIAAIRDALAGVRAEVGASHVENCGALEGRAAEADALAYRPVIAEVAQLRGTCAEVGGDYTAAQEHYLRALNEALASNHDALAISASNRLAYVLTMRLGEPDKGEPWIRVAASLSDRIDADGGLRGNVALTTGAIALVRGHRKEGLAHFERALELLRGFHGERHSSVGVALNNIAIVHAQEGRNEALTERFAEAYALSREYLGADHPTTLMIGGNLSNAYFAVRDYGRAEALVKEIIDRKVALVGADHPDIAILELTFGAIEQRRGLTEGDRERLGRAREHIQRAVAIREAALGPDNPKTAFARISLGEIDNDLGEPAVGQEHLERALEVLSRGDPDAPDRASALARLGRSLSDRGQYRDALARLYEAKRIHDLGNSHPEEVAYTKFQRAVTLAKASRKADDRARARALAEEALAMFRDAGTFDFEVEQVEAWLAAHPAED